MSGGAPAPWDAEEHGELAFGTRDGLLVLGGVALYGAIPAAPPPLDATVFGAIAVCRQAASGPGAVVPCIRWSLREIIGALVRSDVRVTARCDVGRTPGVSVDGSPDLELCVPWPRARSLLEVLAVPPSRGDGGASVPGAGAGDAHTTEAARCVVIRVHDIVSARCAPTLLPPAAGDPSWRWIFRSTSAAVRTCLRPSDSARIVLLHCGIGVRSYAAPLLAREIHIDICHARDEVFDFEWPWRAEADGVAALVQHLLHPSCVREVCNAPDGRQFLRMARPWRDGVASQWRPSTSDYVRHLRGLPSEAVVLLDAERALSLAGPLREQQSLCRVIMERFSPLSHDVEPPSAAHTPRPGRRLRARCLPVGSVRLAELVTFGFFGGRSDLAVCIYGILMSSSHTLFLPFDADTKHTTCALDRLWKERDRPDSGADCWTFRPSVTYVQHAPSLGTEEALVAYRVRCLLDDGALRLERDAEVPPYHARAAQAVDCVRAPDILVDILRRERDAVRSIFPMLAARLEAGRPDDLDAALREARARKVVPSWALEDIDAGGNLSSLGMSLMLAFVLEKWHGARTRVCVSEWHTAMILVWSGPANGYRAVDPCNSSLNALAAPAQPPTTVARLGCRPARGAFIEVRVRTTWHLGRVERIAEYGVTACSHYVVAHLLGSKCRKSVPLMSSRWRLLARDGSSDADSVLGRMMDAGGTE